jgi:hypothetical protein
MNETKMRIRELAAWGFDNDEYRPAHYRGNPNVARAFVADRVPFELRFPLVDPDDYGLQELFAEQEARVDLQAEMAGLDWSLGVVDLRLLLAFQRRIIIDPDGANCPIPASDDWVGLVDLCFGRPKPIACDSVRNDASVVFRSANSNLHFRFTGDSSNPIAIHSGSPFFEVAQYRERWFLRDGYHRAFRCLKAGIFHLPAVIVRAQTVEQLGAVHPWFFSEAVLFSDTPPWVHDFLNDMLVIEYHRAPLRKILRITVEESYTLATETDQLAVAQNENLAASCKRRGGAACTTWPNRGLEILPFTADGPKN